MNSKFSAISFRKFRNLNWNLKPSNNYHLDQFRHTKYLNLPASHVELFLILLQYADTDAY